MIEENDFFLFKSVFACNWGSPECTHRYVRRTNTHNYSKSFGYFLTNSAYHSYYHCHDHRHCGRLELMVQNNQICFLCTFNAFQLRAAGGKFPIPANPGNHKFKHFWQTLSILPTFHMQYAHCTCRDRHTHTYTVHRRILETEGSCSGKYYSCTYTFRNDIAREFRFERAEERGR